MRAIKTKGAPPGISKRTGPSTMAGVKRGLVTMEGEVGGKRQK